MKATEKWKRFSRSRHAHRCVETTIRVTDITHRGPDQQRASLIWKYSQKMMIHTNERTVRYDWETKKKFVCRMVSKDYQLWEACWSCQTYSWWLQVLQKLGRISWLTLQSLTHISVSGHTFPKTLVSFARKWLRISDRLCLCHMEWDLAIMYRLSDAKKGKQLAS